MRKKWNSVFVKVGSLTSVKENSETTPCVLMNGLRFVSFSCQPFFFFKPPC